MEEITEMNNIKIKITHFNRYRKVFDMDGINLDSCDSKAGYLNIISFIVIDREIMAKLEDVQIGDVITGSLISKSQQPDILVSLDKIESREPKHRLGDGEQALADLCIIQ